MGNYKMKENKIEVKQVESKEEINVNLYCGEEKILSGNVLSIPEKMTEKEIKDFQEAWKELSAQTAPIIYVPSFNLNEMSLSALMQKLNFWAKKAKDNKDDKIMAELINLHTSLSNGFNRFNDLSEKAKEHIESIEK